MEDMDLSVVAKKVLDQVLQLPANVRVNLLEQLLTSLNLPTQPEIEQLWAEEAEKRIAQIDKGEVKLVPGRKVFSNIRKKYG
jgi:putative addiction module component (TIGR02574 family)